ncbi:MAG: twin transmembrane helix small protein [Legionellaceae bacterium]|nr:twin transmembrane helix small protein [Legionellaceae bacterium]
MIFKSLVGALMLGILFALSSGLIALVRDDGSSNRTVRALSWRIGLSLTLFILLLLAAVFGWIHPHALGA